MASKYTCFCRYCGKEFLCVDMFREVCYQKQCQKRYRQQHKHKSQSHISIQEVERQAIALTKETGRIITYGQVSLLVDCGIKTF